MFGDDALQALRKALQLSPDNLPLRQHLADTLLSVGRAEEAEHEYRQALALAPEDRQLKLGLAGALYQQGKTNPALVITEGLVKSPEPPARALLLHARLLLQAGELAQARRYWSRA